MQPFNVEMSPEQASQVVQDLGVPDGALPNLYLALARLASVNDRRFADLNALMSPQSGSSLDEACDALMSDGEGAVAIQIAEDGSFDFRVGFRGDFKEAVSGALEQAVARLEMEGLTLARSRGLSN